MHVMQSANGKRVVLTDGTTHKRNKILLVPHTNVIAPTTEKNVIKVATKKHKDKLYFKRESIGASNIIEGKRGTLANQVLLKPEHTPPLLTLREWKTEKYKKPFLRTNIEVFNHSMGIILLHIIVKTVL